MKISETAVYLLINVGNILMPSKPHLRHSMPIVHHWYEANISWCAAPGVQVRISRVSGCWFASLLSRVCSLWSITATGMGCTHRLPFLTAQIRNCWNADSVCLQGDTEHSTPCRHRAVFIDRVHSLFVCGGVGGWVGVDFFCRGCPWCVRKSRKVSDWVTCVTRQGRGLPRPN